MQIPYTRPSITPLEMAYVADAVTYGWGKDCYKYIDIFQDNFKRHIGCMYAIATSSCTGAITLGLAALGIGPGDEVIVADSNWIATVAPVVQLGAKPVFVDIDPVTWCIDPNQIAIAITPRTKAVIATHLYGNLCDLNRIKEAIKEYATGGVYLIEDAAEAIGSCSHAWGRAGSVGDFGVFSFHGTKTITTGEGGMLVTNSENLYKTACVLASHGRRPEEEKQFWPEYIGYKFKMSNIQAALGCAQLERLDELVCKKREIMKTYKDILLSIDGITMNSEPSDMVHGCWMPVAVFDPKMGITRKELLYAFSKRSISTRVFFYPLSSLPMFREKNNPVAYDIPTRAINLPSFHDMTKEDIWEICDVIGRM